MISNSMRALLTCLTFGLFASTAAADDGFKALFDGQSLNGWVGDETFWSVQDGAIVAESTAEKPCDHNTFLQWGLGRVDDFDLRLKFRISGLASANSGIQFRSQVEPDGHVVGYQADISLDGRYTGMIYDEHGRGILCQPGATAVVDGDSPKVRPQDAVANEAAKAAFKPSEWNDYRILAKGEHLQLFINGVQTADLTDKNTRDRDFDGVLALQLHSGPAMKVEFKDIQLKRLPLEHAKKVVFLGGPPSHGVGAHEFNAGSILLANDFTTGVEDVITAVYTNGWPKDPTFLDNVDCLVCGADGQGRHPLLKGIDYMQANLDRGMGLVLWHYAVEADEAHYNLMRSWLGGGFEINYSVNPHWTASFDDLPEHPITNGVPAFEANDEWYYHMRFVPDMKGVTPILSQLPPRESLSRPDGHHSNNPHVRAAVLERKEPQHVAWAYERPDGGRSFGFTGGHFHRNWGVDGFRQVVLNAVAWTAKIDVPSLGVPSSTPTAEDLEENLDGQQKKPRNNQANTNAPAAKPVASTGTVTKRTEGRFETLEADITGARTLTLVVSDAGNGFSCDWADFVEPTLSGAGQTKPLTDLKWTKADAQFGSVQVNKNVQGQPITVGGQQHIGIGTHANSAIHFKLPEGHSFTKLTSRCAIDDGGANQGNCGDQASVQFHVFVNTSADAALTAANPSAGADSSVHDAVNAVSNLDIGEGLEATLFASEPIMYSPSNCDIDHLGRIWVGDVVNYRRFRNNEWPERVEGDRILVLEDTDGDGKADKKTTFYQGREIDSPHGVCVLGNRVIVSAGDSVYAFYDDDNDLKADRKEVMFTGIAGNQHDHGIHSFSFGPDGKLYFNFGNNGERLKDKDGKPVVDKMGNVVDVNDGKYQQGLVFRCDLDGSNVETLGWNFRNNWEVAVDSFGSMWQSDNDDDGNRGVRINYVLEYGNYGYRDEITKAGWREPRTGMNPEIPLQHWHLNDPGVVPNLLQTGAGSPTGIMVYEGNALPDRFHNEIIHCDAGPNVVRAYPVKQEGAGYTASMDPILTGTRDQWFRPSDVTAAPDGSLIVADWYDPGVGGHRMQDVMRGRLFRVAKAGNKWSVPKYDFTTVEGAIEALKSPNLEARYLAFTTLQSKGEEAVPAIVELTQDANARFAARALFLLGKIEGKGGEAVRRALASDKEMLRVVGLRLARQLGLEVASIAKRLASDKSPVVRREVCVALAELPADVATPIWATVASQYDGKDRWMLEALGIAARGRWDACLEAYQKAVGIPVAAGDGAAAIKKPNPDAWRQLVWRSRASNTPELLVELIRDEKTAADELPKLMRAFDFQAESASKNEVLASLAFGPALPTAEATTFVRSEAISRLKDFDPSKNAEYKQRLSEIVEAAYGTPQFVSMVRQFNLTDRFGDLVKMAIEQSGTQNAADAVTVLAEAKKPGHDALQLALSNDESATKLLESIRLAGASRTTPVVLPLIDDEERPMALRRLAVEALSKSGWGAEELVKRAEANTLPDALKQTATAAMQQVRYGHLGDRIAKAFPSPAGKDARPIPPINELVKQTGDAKKGRVVFNTNGTCSKCHVVAGIGKELGPALDEIGSKLSRDAMFVSILYPSAGVSHNYETFTVVTVDGDVITGLKQSETDAEVTIKTVEGLVKKIARDDIEIFEKQDISIMPADLQKVMSNQEIIDVVDYLQTLKKKS